MIDQATTSIALWQEPLSAIQKRMLTVLQNSRDTSPASVGEGTDALALIGTTPLSPITFTKSMAILEANFGVQYPKEKITALYAMVQEKGWSEEQFKMVFDWFLRNKRYPSWTIADWFDYRIPVYGYQWALKQWTSGVKVDAYEMPDGTVVYKPKDGVDLPFKKRD